MNEGEEFVTVAAFLAATEAHILRGRLVAEGIGAIVADANIAQTYDLISIAVGGVKVKVPASQAARAAEVIRAVGAGEYALGDED
jgi:hypothetical protein